MQHFKQMFNCTWPDVSFNRDGPASLTCWDGQLCDAGSSCNTLHSALAQSLESTTQFVCQRDVVVTSWLHPSPFHRTMILSVCQKKKLAASNPFIHSIFTPPRPTLHPFLLYYSRRFPDSIAGTSKVVLAQGSRYVGLYQVQIHSSGLHSSCSNP